MLSTDPDALGRFRSAMTESDGFTVDEFSEWWDTHSSDRKLFEPVQAEIASGRARREASGRGLVEDAREGDGAPKGAGGPAASKGRRKLRRSKD